jgi:hypothetical protein
MDPYLERRWGDVHVSLCVGIRSFLQPLLPPGLRARAEQDVLLETPEDEEPNRFQPDASIVETWEGGNEPSVSSAAVAAEPVVIQNLAPMYRRRWVEILDTADGNRLVTAIEILSPGNKAAGALNEKYGEKLRKYLEGGVNVVEIDLLRSSRRHLAVPATKIPAHRRAEYYVCVCKAVDPSRWLAYPMPLRNPLPAVLIPCREKDAPVKLELQPIIDRIYLEGGHDDLDYTIPPDPPFSAADAEWAAGLIAARGTIGQQ